ncbi:MAG: GNAT family N-acetyltransferase [Deltaproteobacteria bacterium]|nr:MAG: GNAT family N-acetyltransferase [Deltaproteobacteria bacterium]
MGSTDAGAAIVSFGPNDAVGLAEAEVGCFDRPWSAEAYATEIARPFGQVFGVRGPGGSIVAACCLWTLPPSGELLRIFTVPSARRRGLAAALLGRAADLARRAGCREVQLEVDARNAPARRLYARSGFSEIGRRGDYYGPGGDALILSRRLVPGTPDAPLDGTRPLS